MRVRFPDAHVALYEKEKSCGQHASTRNSGVLHAGFYYTSDSLKARFTRDGNRRLAELCEERGIAVNRCGKLVVATNEAELPTFDILLDRARANGVELHQISISEAKQIEPRVRTVGSALFSPNTAVVDPKAVIDALTRRAQEHGVDIHAGVPYIKLRQITEHSVVAQVGHSNITCGYLINAAGLYADRIARDFGCSADYRILPFKGVYLYAEPGDRFRTNIYPVPDLDYPFLGVHFTITAAGRVKIGPTAIPAWWREQYQGGSGFRATELLDIVTRQALLFLRDDFGFRRLAFAELLKYSRRRMVSLAAKLADGVTLANYRKWGPPGIRAQLLNTRTGRLEMDFRIEHGERSTHVLNVVSPGFTCALPFADFVVEQIGAR